ncbi:hypothetical protein BHE74_00038731 [Ensete ventricosum]|nr:hypothetical protein BHE74_00038731 [Ensete ventricosum]
MSITKCSKHRGLQEIVPLNAGNVLVIEDNEPAAKWLSLIDEAMNGSTDSETDTDSHTPSPYATSVSSQASGMKTPISRDSKMHSGPLFFQKPSLKSISKTYRTEQGRRLKACNCPSKVTRKYYRESCFRCQHADISDDDSTDEEEDEEPSSSSVAGLPTTPTSNQRRDAYLKIEREAGRVFKGWKEGKIYFAPTYKYSNNSDTYAGEIVTSKKKRRTPAWYVTHWIQSTKQHKD